MAETMTRALADARISADQVDYVNAHGTSTPLNDVCETRGIRRALGSQADRVWVSSIKSMLGHTVGAAGAIEAIATILSVQQGVVPPTLNLENPDPDCDLDYVPHHARERKIRAALTNSFGFGGHNVTLVVTPFGSRP
jgi:3-oxoacyl-[acyl-carrier-protein] synthase II